MSLHRVRLGSGPDLVLLHGWGMNGAVWTETAERLADRYRVWIPDLPGHGDSPWEGRAGLADWAAACLDAAPQRSVWMGWSLGAQIALRAALDAPERVSGVLAVAGTLRFVRGPGWPSAMDPNTLEQFGRALRGNHRSTLERFLLLQVRGSDRGRATLSGLRRRLAARRQPRPEALEAGLDLLASVDLRTEAGALAPPSRWILGGRDTLVPAAVAPDLRRVLPEADTAVVEGAGHAPFLSHPDDFLACAEPFLAAAVEP